jgi:hypothetical protein
VSSSSRRLVTGLLALWTALLLTVVPTGPAGAEATGPQLPAPTGPLHVDSRSLYLKDTSRADPWRPDVPYRELMASVWYPTGDSAGTPAPYMSAAVSTAAVGSDVLSGVRTNSLADATPLPGRRPLVLLSPGAGVPRFVLSTLAEDLASRGYVGAAVDHTYEAAVDFPDGRTTSCMLCPGQGSATVVQGRVLDLRFVLSSLLAPGTGLPIDPAHVVAMGHGVGGAAAVDLLSVDPRVDGAADLDGQFYTDPPTPPVDRPVLLMSAQWSTADGVPSPNWMQRWSALSGWKRWLSVPSEGHLSFTDAQWLYGQFDLTRMFPPVLAPTLFGTVSADRALTLNRAYLTAFVAHVARRIPTPLLDRPSPAFPEVSFVTP